MYLDSFVLPIYKEETAVLLVFMGTFSDSM